MPLRALWKGAISFGLIHIPVELYPAERRNDLDLDMLDRRDFAPIGYKRSNKHTGEEVSWENIIKGYEYEKEQYVVLSEEELKRVNPAATQTIDLLAFVPAADINPLFYEQPYYLKPVRRGEKVYALLRETLRRSNQVGIGQVVIRIRQHLAALRVMGDALVLQTMRYAHEINSSEALELPSQDLKAAGISEREIKMALALVADMSEAWKPEQYKDSYRDDIHALIERKIAAKETHSITVDDEESEAPADDDIADLMTLLKKSLRGKSRAVTDGDIRQPARSAMHEKKPKTRRAGGSSSKKLPTKKPAAI